MILGSQRGNRKECLNDTPMYMVQNKSKHKNQMMHGLVHGINQTQKDYIFYLI